MKSVIDSQSLLKELKKISPVISKSTVLPILEYVKFDFTKSKLIITGTNLNTTVITKLDCASDCDFSILLPFYYIVDIASKSSTPLTISKNEKNIAIKEDKTSFKLDNSVNVEQYPIYEEKDYLLTVDVNCDFFFALSNADKCKSKNYLQQNMSNVCIDFRKEKTSVVGIDGFIMYKRDFNIKVAKEIKTTVSGIFVSIVKSFQDAKISANDKFVMVEYGNTIVVDTQSETPYVNYLYVLPSQINYNAEVSKSDLMKAVSLVDISANSVTKETKFLFNKDKSDILVKSNNVDFGMESETVVSSINNVEIEGINLNGGMLSTLLNTIDSDEISMSFCNQNTAAYIKPKNDDSILLLIMPLQQK